MSIGSAVGMGEHRLVMTPSVGYSKDLEVRDENLISRYPKEAKAPSMGLALTFEMELPEIEDWRKEKAEKAETDDNAPYFIEDDAEDQPKNIDAQTIYGLRRQVSLATSYDDLGSQFAILQDALGNTQSLINDCRAGLDNAGFASIAAGYIKDLGKVRSQIMQSLASASVPEVLEPAMRLAPEAAGFAANPADSPFRI